ncbi:MAG TPA: WYL domain-containing protein, partial [Puia sp.]|nr:WYL domain-containing protein [Puia sp.]
VVEIEYTNLQKEVSKRKAEPIGWCHLKKNYRDFRVSRILRLQCTGEEFTVKRHMDMGEYMKQLPVDF